MDNLQTKEHWTENTAHRHKKHTYIKNTEHRTNTTFSNTSPTTKNYILCYTIAVT